MKTGLLFINIFIILYTNSVEDATCTAKTHKYLVRATILRDSWPLSESAWPYISMIKSMEKLEERSGSKPGSAKRAKREKGGGGKKGGATPQQSSSQLNQVVCVCVVIG